MGRLLSYLPPFLQEYRELKELLNAQEPEIDRLIQEIEQIKDNQFIVFCNEKGIGRFEKVLNILPNPNDSLDVRISRVIARWNNGIPYTYKSLIEKLDTLCGVGNYFLSANFGEYRLEVIVHLPLVGQYEELDRLLSYLIPANIQVVSSNMLEYEAQGKISTGSTIVKVIEYNIA